MRFSKPVKFCDSFKKKLVFLFFSVGCLQGNNIWLNMVYSYLPEYSLSHWYQHRGRIFSICWRMAWQPTSVFLPGESHGQRTLVGYSPQGCRVRHNWTNLACMHTFSIWGCENSRPKRVSVETERQQNEDSPCFHQFNNMELLLQESPE